MSARSGVAHHVVYAFLIVVMSWALAAHDKGLERARAAGGSATAAPEDDPWRLSPLRLDPADFAWRAERDAPILKRAPGLAHSQLRVGVRRPTQDRDGGGIRYDAYERLSARMLRRADGSHTLQVCGLNLRAGETWELTLPKGVRVGQALRGEFQASSLDSRHRSQELHGTLTLSALPSSLDQTLYFELRARVSPNWEIHAEGPVEVEAEPK